jgi:hypothetical protein
MEQELRDMVAHGVYEAGFANLKKYLSLGQPQKQVLSVAPVLASSGLAIEAPAIRLRDYGKPSEMQLESISVPPPAEGDGGAGSTCSRRFTMRALSSPRGLPTLPKAGRAGEGGADRVSTPCTSSAREAE